MTAPYCPTGQQKTVIVHDGSAFVTACPGAGKTRTLVERARHLADLTDDKRAVAFLSFTNAAVDELQGRLRLFGLLPSPLFPSFIGTFDRFLWQFFIAPFGIPGCAALPRLVPDKNKWEVKPPFSNAQALTLKCFDRKTGVIDVARAGEQRFDTTERNPAAWERCARRIIQSAVAKGLVDFDDVRLCIAERLTDKNFAERVGTALAARFREIVVDEAQDCNASDLAVVDWLRRSGLSVKVICDPHQSIFKFRGGITKELLDFADTFDPSDRLVMSGNFRSTAAICAAIVALRPPSARADKDEAIGKHKDDPTPIHLLSYGSGVSTAIGATFTDLVRSLNIPIGHAPVLASRLQSACKAIGQPTLDKTSHMTLLLAKAVMSYHFAFAVGNRREALIDLHRTILFIQGHIEAMGDYHNHLADSGIIDGCWRPDVIAVANELRYEPGETPDQWLARARISIGAGMATGLNVNKRLRSHAKLATALAAAPVDAPPPRTIHSAKGLEFPAVCVVMTSNKAGMILDYLEGDTSNGADEDARKIYVAASRAERLLVMAIPKNTSGRMQGLFTSVGCAVQVHKI